MVLRGRFWQSEACFMPIGDVCCKERVLRRAFVAKSICCKEHFIAKKHFTDLPHTR